MRRLRKNSRRQVLSGPWLGRTLNCWSPDRRVGRPSLQRESWGRWLVFGVAWLFVGCTEDLTVRRVVRDATYSADKKSPPPDYELRLYARIRPLLDRPYLDCAQATKVLGVLTAERLVALGARLDGSGLDGSSLDASRQREATAKVGSASHWARATMGILEQDEPGWGDDPLLALAVGEAAHEVFVFAEDMGKLDWEDRERSISPSHVSRLARAMGGSPEPSAEVLQATNRALQSIVEHLTRLQNAGSCSASSRTDSEAFLKEDVTATLALGGGAANGAYTAGVLFELFSLRERLLVRLPDEQVNHFLKSTGYSSVAGTSVGALIAQLTDLYFTDRQEIEDEEPFRRALCAQLADQAAGPRYKLYQPKQSDADYFSLVMPPAALEALAESRVAQIWALAMLQRYFTDVGEPETICVQEGSAARLVGALGSPHPGLMRFAPLEAQVIQPMLQVAAPTLVANSHRRIVHAVEIHQNLSLGLDETACWGLADEALRECLSGAVMASVVQPLFAQPVNRVHTGLSTKQDCGIWLDAGVRSGLPVVSALRRSRPALQRPRRSRVFALSTARVGGIPSSGTATLMGIGMEAIGEMSHQIQLSEVAHARREAQLEQLRYEALYDLYQKAAAPLESSARRPSAALPFAGPALGPRSPDLLVHFVPETVPMHLVASAGYRFDPYVLRGLFVFGRYETVRRLGLRGTSLVARDRFPVSSGSWRRLLGFEEGLKNVSQAGPVPQVAHFCSGLSDPLPRPPARVDCAGSSGLDCLDQLLVHDEESLGDWVSYFRDPLAGLPDLRWDDGRERFNRQKVKGKRARAQKVMSCAPAPGLYDAPAPQPAKRGKTAVAGYFGGRSAQCRSPAALPSKSSPPRAGRAEGSLGSDQQEAP